MTVPVPNIAALLTLACIALSAPLPIAAQVWIEPQIGPSAPIRIVFDTSKPFATVTENKGLVSLWDVSNPRHPIRISSIPTDAQAASLRMDLGLIATGGRNGKVSLWNLDGSPHGPALAGHEKPIYAVLFSADTGMLASGDADGTVRMWNLDGTPHGPVLRSHSAAVTSISNRGALWASGSLDGTVRLWNSDGTRTYPLFKTGGKGVYSAALSPDGKTLLAGGKDGLLCIWRLDKPDEVQFIQGHDKDVFSVAFNSSGDLFASASSDGTIRLWNNHGTAYGSPIKEYGEDFTSVSFSPLNDVLAAVTASNTVRLWSMQPTEYSVPLKGYAGYISPVAFSPNGRSIATVGKDGVARVADLVGKRNALSLQGSRFPTSLVFSPLGDVVAAAGEFYAKPGDKSSVILWDSNGTKLREIKSGSATQIVALAFSRKGQFLAGLDLKGEVSLWDTNGRVLGGIPADGAGVMSGHGYPKGAIAISRDDTLLAFVGKNETAQLWRLEPNSHKLLGQVAAFPRIATLAISPALDLLATSSTTDGGPSAPATVQLRRLDGAVVRDFPVGQFEISSLTFTSDGALLISADQMGTLTFSNLDGSAHFPPIRAHERFEPSVASSPTGNVIASTGIDGIVRLWDLDPSPYAQFPGFVERTISAIAISPQRDIIVAGTTDGGVLFLKPDGSSLARLLTPHRGRVTAVTWSANGTVVASADAYGAIKLWRRDGTGLPDLSNPSGNGSSPLIALSPDGRYLATSDVSLRICLIAAGTCQEFASGPAVHLAFSPAGSQLTVTDAKGVVETMDTNGKRLQVTRHLHGKMMYFEGKPLVAIGSKKGRLVFVDDQGCLHLIADLTGREEILVTHRNVAMIGLSNDEDFLAAIDRSGGIQLWNLEKETLVSSRELGSDLDQVGFVGSSIYALDTHNNFCLLDHALSILARLNLGTSNSMAVSRQWFTVSGDVNDGVKGFRRRAEQLSPAELSRYISPEYFDALFSGPSAAQRVLLTSAVLFRDLKQRYSSLSSEQKSGAWLTLLFLVTFVWWSLKPATFVRWAMESVAETSPPTWKVAVKWLNLARGLGMTYHSRSAWLKNQRGRLLEDLFEGKASVQRRKAYAELQNKSAIDAWRTAIRDGKPFHAWIQGPGGYGKSALAFRMARLASESGRIIPILIEEDWGTDIYRYIGSRLEYCKRRPAKGLLQRFIGDGQLCIIIDGVSERRIPDVLDQVEAFERDSGVKFIVVTSRDAPRSASSWFSAKVGPVDPNEIGSFLEAYSVPKENIDDIGRQLGAFVNQKPASQLLLRLAVEHLLLGAMLPRTYAELVQDYVLGLRPSKVLSEVEFMRLARVSAECCVLATLTPRQVTSEYIVGYLAKDALAQPFLDVSGLPRLAPIVLDDMVKCGLMFRLLVQGSGYVGFSEDPVSEYLAAMHVVGKGARSTADLQKRLNAANGTAAGLRKALGDVLDWRKPTATAEDPGNISNPQSVAEDFGATPV